MPLTILEGSTFCICNERGDIDGETQGLFADDTRFLSQLRLTINGALPLLLSSGKVEYFSAAFYLRNPIAGGLPADTVSITRQRFVGDGHAGPDRRPEPGHGTALVRARDRARDRLRGHPLGQGARLRARRPGPRRRRSRSRSRASTTRTRTSSCCGSATARVVATTQVIFSQRGEISRRQGRLRPRARAARGLGAPARHPGLDRRRLGPAARRRAAFRRGDDARARVAGGLAAPCSADSQRLGRPRAQLPPVRVRSRVTSDARRRPDGTAPGRGHALVHDRLRPRHADHLPADAPVRA